MSEGRQVPNAEMPKEVFENRLVQVSAVRWKKIKIPHVDSYEINEPCGLRCAACEMAVWFLARAFELK
jgi:hypothetical protein